MIRRYNFLQSYGLSFFSESLYRDVAQTWKGIGFFYLLILLLITWFPIMLTFHYDIKKIVDEKLPPIIQQIPQINFADGVTSIDQTSPVTIKDPVSNTNIAVIDTSGRYKTLADVTAYLLLTKDRLYVKTDAGTKVYNVESFGNHTITQDDIRSYADNFKNWAIAFFYPVVILISMIYRLLLALLLAVIGIFLIAKVVRVTLPFQTIYRLTIVAMTPAIILATVCEFLHFSERWMIVVYAIISVCYLYFALQANAKSANGQAPMIT